MTINQLTYQANKIKQQEADIKSALAELERSKHLHEYGRVLKEPEYGGWGALKMWKDMSEVSKNIFGSAKLFR